MALIKCKECGKEISDQATTCPNCGAKTETAKHKKKNIITVLFIILIIAIVGTSVYFVKSNNPLHKYSQEAITILKKYKNNELSNNDAGDKINTIYNYVDKDYSINDNIDYLSLRSILSLIQSKLYFDGIDFKEIDTYIKELREY